MHDDGGAEEEHDLGAACMRVPVSKAGLGVPFGRRG